jgi:hypothetical protein
MREPYVPLFCSITDSTIWSLDAETCKVFITMLAMADPEGYVAAAVDGIAGRSRLSIEQVESAIQKLSAPDPRSRNKSSDGRRIVEVDRGWLIPAIPWFRELARHEAEKARKRKWARANNSGRPMGASEVARPTETETETETEREIQIGLLREAQPKSALRTSRKRHTAIPDGWEPSRTPAIIALEQKVHVPTELAQFRDRAVRDGATYVDWDAAWRTWLRNAARFGRTNNTHPTVKRPGETTEAEAMRKFRGGK